MRLGHKLIGGIKVNNKSLFSIQKNISIVFIALLIFLTFTKVIYILNTTPNNFFNLNTLISSYIPIYLILIICFLISFKINSDKIRYMQILLFLFQSYFSLFQALDSFWGWGLGIVTINLAYRYHYFETKFLRKILLFFVGFIIVSAISIKINNLAFVDILGQIIFFLFIALFFIIINIKDFAILLREKTNEIFLLNNFILFDSDYDEQLSNNNLKNSNKLIIQKKETLEELKISTQNKLKQNKKIQLLTDEEFELIIKFFLARGNLTNKELAYNFDVSENVIKNRLRNIYKKLEVSTRTALLAFLDDYIS